jgi:tRNA G26 N,N-dimethylase Trm1
VIERICDKLGLPTISIKKVHEALKNDGFEVSLTHFNPKGLRTNAPTSAIVKLLQKLYVEIRSFK